MQIPAPQDTSEAPAFTLVPAERMLLVALQSWLSEPAAAHVQTIAKALAWRTSPRVAAAFVTWVHAIEAAGLRPLEATCVRCGGPSRDVQRLVVACGLAPVDLSLGERLIEPLVCETRSVMLLGRLLNSALSQAGWPLPARLGGPPPATPHRTLH